MSLEPPSRAIRITAVCGSLQASSGNLSLLRAAASLAPEGVEVALVDGVRALPHFDPDLESRPPPAPVASWRRALADCDAVLIASPEYGHSLPGSLKNAIDWVIGSGELYRKPVAITCSVADPDRGRRGLAALAGTLLAVDARVVWSDPIVRGPGVETRVAEVLRALAEAARG